MIRTFVELPAGHEMRMRFIHAVDRPINKLTVEQLCRSVGVSRQTFYRYFPSKTHMPLWYSSFCDEITLREIGRTLSWGEGLQSYLELLSREREFFAFTLDRMERNRAERNLAVDRLEGHFRETVCLRHGADALQRGREAEELSFCINVAATVVVRSVSDWMSAGMSTPPEKLARFIKMALPQNALRAIGDRRQ
ncbi:MAG: helix-turn-helix transcriptional regulator [Adlercreutzia mucosicola]|nr:helix-turn-helix transcriptional regulator [Adlercreutzia mucosicola]